MTDLIARNITPARALQALYAATVPRGHAALQARPGPLSDEEAEDIVRSHTNQTGGGEVRFGVVMGRVLAVSLVSDGEKILVQRVDQYDRDTPDGNGTAMRALTAAGATVEVVQW